MWKRACDPEGPGLRGLVTANVVRSGRVARGARSYFVMKAPDGTRFARLSWSGQARRRDCRYALQLWASRPDGAPVPIKHVRANRRCPRPKFAQAAGWPRARTYDIQGATKIVQRVVCVGSKKTPYCSSRGLNYIRTFKAQATVVDVSPPAIGIIQDNAFTRGEWVSGVQNVSYGAWDNAGVRVVRPILAERRTRRDTPWPCDFSRPVPCTNGQGSVSVDTRGLAEGTQSLVLQAEDAAGNPGTPAPSPRESTTRRPGRSRWAWRAARPGEIRTTSMPLGSTQTRATARRSRWPTTGYAARGTAQCVEGAQSGIGIGRLGDLAVPAPANGSCRVWREDAAGNKEPANASVPVALRYDPDPPQLGFEPSPPADPTVSRCASRTRRPGLPTGRSN